MFLLSADTASKAGMLEEIVLADNPPGRAELKEEEDGTEVVKEVKRRESRSPLSPPPFETKEDKASVMLILLGTVPPHSSNRTSNFLWCSNTSM